MKKYRIRPNVPSVSIGIPAHNEEGNIKTLLKSILSQNPLSYQLESVWVICDGCTDRTAEIAGEFASKYPFIKVFERTQRTGKAEALNYIYKLNESDYLLTIDADIVFANKNTLSQMVKVIHNDPKLKIVGPRHVPVPSKTLMGKFAVVSYQSLEDAFLQLNSGNNFYGIMSVALMKKKFAKSFKYPKGTISDQCFIYAQATRRSKKAFQLVQEAEVLFRTVETFHDWRLLGLRSVIGDKADVAKHFGPEILEEYKLPRELVIKSMIKWFFKTPLLMTGSVLMNIFIRKFPYKKMEPKNGMWTTSMSSKRAIT